MLKSTSGDASSRFDGVLDTPDHAWRTSTLCANNGCVAVAVANGQIRVRDAKHTDGPELVFDAVEWAAFTGGVKMGEFDL